MRGTQPPRIWCTQDASLVSEAMGIDPQVLLKNLEGATRPEFEMPCSWPEPLLWRIFCCNTLQSLWGINVSHDVPVLYFALYLAFHLALCFCQGFVSLVYMCNFISENFD